MMRKIIDEHGRLFGFISVIDIVCIIIVAVLAIAVFYRAGGDNSATVGTVPVTYTITISNIRENTTKLLLPLDKLYTDSGIFIGEISYVDVSDAWATSQLADGTFKRARSFDRYDVTLTVRTQCSVANGSYYADKTYELCANTEQKIVTKYVTTTGVITKIMVDTP